MRQMFYGRGRKTHLNPTWAWRLKGAQVQVYHPTFVFVERLFRIQPATWVNQNGGI